MNPHTVDAASLFETPPPVNPAVIATADRPEPAEPTVSTGPTDTAATDEPTGAPSEQASDEPAVDDGGTPFDPARHIPTKHPRTGRWMPRRPKSDASSSGTGPPVDTGSFVAPDEPAPEPTPETGRTAAGPTDVEVCDVMADLHCRAFYGIAVAFLSDEWIASRDEHRANVATLAAYYRAKNIRPDSPGWALAAQALAYAGTRLQMPKTQSRLARLRAWFGQKVADWRGKRRSAALRSVE